MASAKQNGIVKQLALPMLDRLQQGITSTRKALLMNILILHFHPYQMNIEVGHRLDAK